ncbi:ABC transporter permease [Sulfuricystis multivorans]|uniref:ABC transporter permease n=1 Tax=Sulfuricystis multivorans TaxID=2211108 RepID=UPI000F83C1C6|nr:FtsX-like permease family protein [Sulfuricystis multivorans]
MRVLALFPLVLRNLLRQRRRALIAVFSVAFGIAALSVANGYIAWMFYDFREATIESQYAHIQLTRPHYHEDGRADPFRFLLPEDSTAASLAKLDHVRGWGARLAFSGLLSKGETTLSFIGEGFNPATDLTGDRALRIIAGRKLTPADRNTILLGKGLALQLGAQPSDAVVILVDNPGSGLSAIDANVAGIFESVSKAYDDSALLVPIDDARKLLKVSGAHSWLVYLDKTENTATVAEALRRQFDPRQFEVRTWDQLAEFYARAVDLFRQQLDVVRFIVFAIILLGIGNTMMMSVMERTGEIGTMMALGVRRRAVLGQFLAEGALIGLLGGISGLLLAWLASIGVDALQIEMPPPPSLTRGYIARILLTPTIAAEALGIAVMTTVLASLYPAWKASRMMIVDALRKNK